MATKGSNLVLVLTLSSYLFFISPSHCFTDTLFQGQQLRDWGRLDSADGNFRLEFFSPAGASKNRYLGISYISYKQQRPMWVANRNNPISDESGMLYIDILGELIIARDHESPIILSSAQRAVVNASATLLDSGNFVLQELNPDGSIKRILWQSFDYPTDTLLPGMKLGMNLKTGHTWSLTSWRSDQVPGPGTFTLGLDTNGSTQLVIWWQGKVYWSSGLLNGTRFEFFPPACHPFDPRFSYISNENEKYLTFSGSIDMNLLDYRMDSKGVILEAGTDSFGPCSSSKGNDGCVMQKLPECRNPNDRFEERQVFPSNLAFKFDEIYNLSLFDCHNKCMNNCSCIAYGSTNSSDQTGCQIWSRGTIFSDYSFASGVIHILHKDKAKWWIWPVTAVAGVLVVLVLCYIWYLIRRKLSEEGKSKTEQEILFSELELSTTRSSKSCKTKKLNRNRKKSHDLQIFSFKSIASASNNFSTRNKLGEGGYGRVYKGKLHDGQKIAIKRLWCNSGQGLVEFKNELILLSKVQHNNLVRLVGCCIQREEKILVYEYMPNKSLDFFLFDPSRKNLLDWKKRFNIIEGIAQGLLYLHKYSSIRMIFRDLKVGNILLDDEMNPKISDFGMARIFGRNEYEAITRRVVGTFCTIIGYMSPEYIIEGRFSMKSDVFSFGVMLLEIVSGRKNNGFHHVEYPLNLIGQAWELWREGRILELLDPPIANSNHNNEVLRCIHMGLLCVQDSPAERPTMSDVVCMISNKTVPLPTPKQPAIFTGKNQNNLHFSPARTP